MYRNRRALLSGMVTKLCRESSSFSMNWKYIRNSNKFSTLIAELTFFASGINFPNDSKRLVLAGKKENFDVFLVFLRLKMLNLLVK